FPGEGELLLEARDFGVRGIERALTLVQRVARREVLVAQPDELRLRVADVRLQRFEPHAERGNFACAALACTHRLLRLRVPQQMLRMAMPAFELVVLRG